MAAPTKKERFFRATLLDFFKRSGRDHLPWRTSGITAYEVWVSEIMLQQTQVSRVIGYYERFLKRFPTVETLARANWDDFLPYYAGLGYYNRGRNMLKAARVVVAEHKGVFPRDIKALEALPGVGPYTARAIASFAYGAPHLAWDTNLKRVVGRYFRGGKGKLTGADEIAFDRLWGREAKKLNAALMDFGSSLCVARPKCGACPFRPTCQYAREGGKGEAKAKKKRLKKKEAVSAIVFLHENHKTYYSSKSKSYAPFALPTGYVTRQAIKEYFDTQYGLKLSVRPPHGVGKVNKLPVVHVHAQILLGRPRFPTFPKSAYLRYTRGT